MGILKAPNENCSQLWASEALNANDNDSHSARLAQWGYKGGMGVSYIMQCTKIKSNKNYGHLSNSIMDIWSDEFWGTARCYATRIRECNDAYANNTRLHLVGRIKYIFFLTFS